MVERRPKVLDDIDRFLRHDHHPKPARTYAIGRNNHEHLRSIGVKCQFVTEEPVMDFDGIGERNSSLRGGRSYGYCTWRHKTEIMRIAMQAYGEIVWLDWDAKLTKPLPEDFWQRMRRGRPIQMSLIQYHIRTCVWRGRRDTRAVPEGAFIYCRDRRIIDDVNALYVKHPTWVDQTIFAKIMDEMAGGWPGVEAYKRLGFEPYCQRIYDQFHKPEEVIFVTSKGPSHQRWLKKRRGREAGQA